MRYKSYKVKIYSILDKEICTVSINFTVTYNNDGSKHIFTIAEYIFTSGLLNIIICINKLNNISKMLQVYERGQ